MLLTGDVITGHEAKELNLVSKVTEDGPSAVAEAMSIASRMAAQG